MQTTSALYKQLFADLSSVAQVQAVVGGVTYSGQDQIVECAISRQLFSQVTPGIGNCCSAELDLTLMPSEAIPRMAEIKVSIRYVSGSQTSEWVPQGTFYIDTRSTGILGEVTIHAYDAMLKADQPFFTGGDIGTWPQAMASVAQQIATAMGVTIDSRTNLNANYTMEFPGNELTMRTVLGYIGAANGGNWIISPTGQLLLVPFMQPSGNTAVGQALSDLQIKGVFDPYSQVVLTMDEETAYTAGAPTGRTLTATCPWATQAMATAILQSITGYVYNPFEGTQAILDPAAELGDNCTVGAVTAPLSKIKTTYDALCAADISATADEEIDHEYPYQSQNEQQIVYKVAQAKASLQVGIDQITSQVEGLSGDVSQITQTVDNISLSVTTNSDQAGQTTASITLTVGPNQYTGYIKITGNVDVSGQLSAEALYAAFGDVADLSVNRLTTSRRIVKYLANDTTDDNYIDIHGQQIQCIAGVYAGGTAQATNPSGALLYWETDPADASIGSDGYPYVDGNRIFTTTTETQWPVMVYTYTDQVKRAISFEQIGQYYTPVDTFGVGDQAGNRVGQLVKGETGMSLSYKAEGGKEISLTFNDDGYTDLTGLRKPTNIIFTEEGFSVTVDGGLTEEFTYTQDPSGNITAITDSTGHITTISGVSQ